MANDKPEIIRRLRLMADLTLESPLLIGTGENDNITDTMVLRNKDGFPVIPGTSLAGVLRSKNDKYFGLIDEEGRKKAKEDESYQSVFVVDDIVLKHHNGVVVRDGVRINDVTNIGEKKGKFDYEAVERGAKGKLEIIANIRKYQEEEIEDIKSTLEGIGERLYQGLQLGALTRRGFGKVVGSNVWLDDYDFSEYKNVLHWLKKEPAEKRKKVEKKEFSYSKDTMVMELELHLSNSLLVRSDDFDEKDYEGVKGGKGSINSVQMKSRNEYVIPGASVRGVIRHHAKKILTVLGKDETMVRKMFGFSDKDTKEKKRGHLITEEVYFGGEGYKQTRIKIDRFTGGTIDGALMTNVPVLQSKASDTLKMRFLLEKATSAEIGLMLLVAKDICTGRVAFGGEKSIGRGVMSGVNVMMTYDRKEINITCNGSKVRFSGKTADGELLSEEEIRDLLESYVTDLNLGGENNG